MKTIGLIGGMSWESTITYYQIINETVKEKLGGLHSAKIMLYSVDFFEIEKHMKSGDWEAVAKQIGEAAKTLEQAGAELILICTNTIQKVVPRVKEYIHVPLLHIAQATAEELRKDGCKKAALLGTRYTMQQEFYKTILEENGIEVLIPEEEDIELVDRVIFEELCLGIVKDESRNEYIRIINDLNKKGAEGVILGCTELGILISQKDTNLSLYDTTVIHAKKAVELALA